MERQGSQILFPGLRSDGTKYRFDRHLFCRNPLVRGQAYPSARDSWIEWVSFSDTIELGDLLSAPADAHLWDALDFETKNHETNKLLVQIPRQQRQALVLSTVYGYPPEEIADFQDRSPDGVRSDIAQGRQQLERHFLEDYLPTLQEQLEAGRSRRKGLS